MRGWPPHSHVPREAHGVRFVSKTSAGTGCADRRPRAGHADSRGGGLAADSDSAREILELLELELGAMIRQLERAANSVAGGAEATAATLSHHSPAHRRPDRAHQRRAVDRDHLLAGRRQVHPFGRGHRLAGARRRASSPIRPAPPPAKPASTSIACANPRPRSAMSST